MSMYVPLFSAVIAKYQGGRADAPRLISLDEAFAGVDNRNIRDMFRLMTEFEFDFIINSQVLWGDCDTLDALSISFCARKMPNSSPSYHICGMEKQKKCWKASRWWKNGEERWKSKEWMMTGREPDDIVGTFWRRKEKQVRNPLLWRCER